MKMDNIQENFQDLKNTHEVKHTTTENSRNSSDMGTKTGLKQPFIKARYFVVLMAFLGDFFFYYQRITMSVSIVAMVNSSALPEEATSESCLNLVKNSTNGNISSGGNFEEIEGEFQWPPEVQGYIVGTSFLCYLIAVPFFAKLAEIYGGKIILFWSLFLASVFTFLTPFAAKLSVYAVIVVQSLRGIAQGGVLPTESVLVANWCPISERGISYTFIASGCSIGAVLGSYISGWLCNSTLLGGWKSAFFVSGTVGFIMSLVLLFFLYDNPSVHPKLSLAEYQYIISNQENALTEKRPKTPWRSLFTSVPVYALGFAYFGQMWALAHFLSIHPTFLKTILHYSVEQDGLWTALPFLLQFFTAQIGSILSTLLNNRNYISVDKARKFWTFVSCSGYSVCVLGIYFVGCNRSTSVILSVLALSFAGFGYAGCWIVSTDMSPTFAASVNAITCTMGSFAHFILPVIVGYLTNESQLMEQWHKIFFICIAVVLSSGVVFAIFGSAEIQPWNAVPESNSIEMNQKTEY